MKLKANGIEINYEFQGDGPVVTFGDALGTNLSLWEEQARALQGRYRVLRFDTRGHEDPGTPVEMAREIHRALPSAELVILRSASHLSNLEQPAEFNRVVLGFLDKSSGRSRL